MLTFEAICQLLSMFFVGGAIVNFRKNIFWPLLCISFALRDIPNTVAYYLTLGG